MPVFRDQPHERGKVARHAGGDLNTKTREALKTKNVQDRYAEVAIETLDLNAAETQAFMERQTKNWKSLVEQVAAK